RGSGGDNNVYLNNWLEEGKKKLDSAREALYYICEPVQPPRQVEQYLLYFCGNAADPGALEQTEQLRVTYYKATAAFIRAYSELAHNLEEAGYDAEEIEALNRSVELHTEIRAAIKKHSGEELDLKPYEADMRYLINTYVHAEAASELGKLDDESLIDLIVRTGVHDAVAEKLNARGTLSKDAVAEGIINNVRKTIIRDQLTDPRFYEHMSVLLDDLIAQQRDSAEEYE